MTEEGVGSELAFRLETCLHYSPCYSSGAAKLVMPLDNPPHISPHLWVELASPVHY